MFDMYLQQDSNQMEQITEEIFIRPPILHYNYYVAVKIKIIKGQNSTNYRMARIINKMSFKTRVEHIFLKRYEPDEHQLSLSLSLLKLCFNNNINPTTLA